MKTSRAAIFHGANHPFTLESIVLPPLREGEILVRGELVMHGYWQAEAETARTIIDGWLHTGDIGHIDTAGRIVITDRKKDMIVNDKGDNISPQRVEGMLTLQPEIAQVMVSGDKRPYVAVVEKVRQFTFADEPFGIDNEELTPSMKIRRHKIRERYGARIDALYRS